MKIRLIESLVELLRLADRWDDLWWRSSSSMPTQRAALLAQWVEQFSTDSPFIALVVEEDDGQWIAALPLVGGHRGRMVPVGELPTNCWAESGDLLLEEQADQATAITMIVQAIRQLPWPLVSFDGVDLDTPRWKLLRAALDQENLRHAVRAQYHVGLIDIHKSWQDYEQAWSSNHRHAVKKSHRKILAEGSLELRRYRSPSVRRLDELLQEAFTIEDRSWKGAAGSSVIRSPGMFDYFRHQAYQLARWGQLEILLLEHQGTPIAFEYCFAAKGVVSSHKIGYDESFARFGPGRLLRYLQLQRYYRDQEHQLFNTLGVLCSAKAKWCTRLQTASRLLCSTGSMMGNQILSGYRHLFPWARKFLGREEQLPSAPKLGAARLLEKYSSPATAEPTNPAQPEEPTLA